MNSTSSFGAWLRQRRRVLDLTQAELAQQAGCAVVTIRKLETDERRPSKQLAAQLAACLSIPREEYARFLALARANGASTATLTPSISAFSRLSPTRGVDWDEAPDVGAFYGRTTELVQLRRWLLQDR